MTDKNPAPDEIKYYNEINPIWKKLGLHKISNWEALTEAFELGEKKARDEILEQVLKIIKDEGNKLWEEESVISKIENPIINKIKELQSSNNPEPIMLKDKQGSNSKSIIPDSIEKRNPVLSICENCKNRDLSGTDLVCLHCGNNKKSKGDKSE